MCNLTLDRGNYADFTSVSNRFIDEFMPFSNGEFVKIYLHLLRLTQSGDESMISQLTTEDMAVRFGMSEGDVMRALSYWDKLGLLTLSYDSKGNIQYVRVEHSIGTKSVPSSNVNGIQSMPSNSISGIQAIPSSNISDIHTVAQMTEQVTTLKAASGQSSPVGFSPALPSRVKYSPSQLASFRDDERFNIATLLLEAYLGKTLSHSEVLDVIYIIDSLDMPSELIEYIIESSINLGHRSVSFMQKKACEYYRNSIFTVSEARDFDGLHMAVYQTVCGVFGITKAVPVKKELELVSKWIEDYSFKDDIIIEAANRTMEHTRGANFSYMDTILTNWYNSGVREMKDIEALDKEHADMVGRMYQPQAPSKAAAGTSQAKAGKSSSKKASFNQRTYDYDMLERKLIKANRIDEE